jgi:hypothetical protein
MLGHLPCKHVVKQSMLPAPHQHLAWQQGLRRSSTSKGGLPTGFSESSCQKLETLGRRGPTQGTTTPAASSYEGSSESGPTSTGGPGDRTAMGAAARAGVNTWMIPECTV